MKHHKKRIAKILDELTIYLFSIGATDININIADREEDYRIFIRSNYKGNQDDKIARLTKGLNTPKREEMEEYYWELTGECDIATELHLVGMMLDKAEINIIDDYLELILYRNK